MNEFCKAVNNCPSIKTNLCPGLKALGSNSKYITSHNKKKLEGSVDIDTATIQSHQGECRWDYAIGYDRRVYFVEVHPANTSNIKEVIKKKEWLSTWLREEAQSLDALPKDGFYWIHSGKNAILRTSPQARTLAQSHITLKNHLHLK